MTISGKDLLAAARFSYGGGDGQFLTDYERVRSPIIDSGTSLRAEVLVNSEGEYIVSFAGTGGLEDGFQDVKLGWEQWTQARDEVLGSLSEVLGAASDAQIQFTGHSLGGMLAQYAAYDAIDLLSERLARPSSEIASQLEVTTFNAPGGIDGLEAYLPDEDRVYDPTLTGGLDATHYTVEGDLVSRLGGRHLGGNTRQLADPAYRLPLLQSLMSARHRWNELLSRLVALLDKLETTGELGQPLVSH